MALLMIHIKTKTCPSLWKIIKLSLQFLLKGYLLIFYSTSADGLLGMAMSQLSLKLHLRDYLLDFYGTSVVMFAGQGQNTLQCCLNFHLSFICACLIELCYSAT